MFRTYRQRPPAVGTVVLGFAVIFRYTARDAIACDDELYAVGVFPKPPADFGRLRVFGPANVSGLLCLRLAFADEEFESLSVGVGRVDGLQKRLLHL